jgi:exopolysaccharide biosynthesis protein
MIFTMRAAKRATSILLAGALTIQACLQLGVSQASAAEASAAEAAAPTAPTTSTASTTEVQPKLTLISEEMVTAGVKHRNYKWSYARKNVPFSTLANVIEIDLQNPHVKLDVMTANGETFHGKQTVLGMAKDKGAVAGINGDFFHMTLDRPPLGPQISNSIWMASPLFTDGWYTFGITKDNKPIIDHYTFEGKVTAANGKTYNLAGINRAAQWNNGVHSHVDKIHLYTSAWGQTLRAEDGHYTPTEVLVKNNTIIDISLGKALPYDVPKDGIILRANKGGAEFVKANLQIGDKLVVDYNMRALDPSNQADVKGFKMMIGGHTLMVKDGTASAFSTDVKGIDGYRSRSGVGYSKDGRYVYLITVDNSGISKGMNMKEFQQFMIQLGVWKGMNLDGGGSTTLVSRPLGETAVELANNTEFGSQRRVVNGLGVYTTAPQGELAGFSVTGRDFLFLRESASYQVKAYDTYYNPLKADASAITWSAANRSGTFEGSVFTPTTKGTTTITASSGSAKHSKVIEVIGREQLAGLKINTAPIVLRENSTYQLPVLATMKSGGTRTVPAELIDWEIIGFEASMNNGTLTTGKLAEQTIGQLVAQYDGFSTVMNVAVGHNKLWADFDTLSYPISHDVYPAEVTGDAWIVEGLPDRTPTDKAMFITYNFTQGTGNKASYAEISESSRIKIDGAPYQMNMNVYGDRSGNWLRTEVWDANGKLQRININTNIDWHGWKKVSVNLEDYNLAYPITMQHIYVASPAEGQEQRVPIGQIAIDDISFDYLSRKQPAPKQTIKLVVNEKTIKIGDQFKDLDQAPILEKGTTLVPIRFVVDAIGGEVEWDAKTQKVTVHLDGDRIEMWIGNKDINVNGQVAASLLAPRIVNQRTMVPLRLVSEHLGWKVSWDQSTKTITLE